MTIIFMFFFPEAEKPSYNVLCKTLVRRLPNAGLRRAPRPKGRSGLLFAENRESNQADSSANDDQADHEKMPISLAFKLVKLPPLGRWCPRVSPDQELNLLSLL
jgi:hypothetical protein